MIRRVVRVRNNVIMPPKRMMLAWLSRRSRNKLKRARARKVSRKKVSKKRVEKSRLFNESEYKTGLKKMIEYLRE